MEDGDFKDNVERFGSLRPKITKRTPGKSGDYLDGGRDAPGHHLDGSAKPQNRKKDLKRWCGGKVGRTTTTN